MSQPESGIDAVRPGATRRDQLVAQAARQRHVGEAGATGHHVQMAELPAAARGRPGNRRARGLTPAPPATTRSPPRAGRSRPSPVTRVSFCSRSMASMMHLQVHLKSSAGSAPIWPMSELMTIGALAERTGVASSALRFYEERGLISSERTAAGPSPLRAAGDQARGVHRLRPARGPEPRGDRDRARQAARAPGAGPARLVEAVRACGAGGSTSASASSSGSRPA